jgi:hypothetical protein
MRAPAYFRKFIPILWIVALSSTARPQSNASINVTGIATNNPDIPLLVRADGRLTDEAYEFTTKAYELEALKLVIVEANKVAKELDLTEQLPISFTNLARSFIVGYGVSLMRPGIIGNIHTRDYGYFVSVGHKLSFIEDAHQEKDCMEWATKYRWPASQIDTNGAFQLAVQWMKAVSMDVKELDSNCVVRIEPDPYWNAGLIKKGNFVPIYDVFWISAKNRAKGYGDTAFVSLFLPTKTLISLRVEDSRYILRKPLVFTNLDFLLSQINPLPRTNVPP